MFRGVGWYIGRLSSYMSRFICDVPGAKYRGVFIILSFYFISSFPFKTFPYAKSLDPTAKFMSD